MNRARLIEVALLLARSLPIGLQEELFVADRTGGGEPGVENRAPFTTMRRLKAGRR